MKQKSIIKLVIMLLLIPTTFANDWENTSIPSVDQLEKIKMFNLGSPWRGGFCFDGSGWLGYGNQSLGLSRIPVGSFSFEDVYNLIIPHLYWDGRLDEKNFCYKF